MGYDMAGAKLRLYFREPTVDTNLPITQGTVKPEGFEIEVVRSLEQADAWDCGFAARMQAHAAGEPLVSIPAFPNRKFRLSYIYVNAAAGIGSPKDLEGKRVGIVSWANTAGIWARGALQHHYGVDLARIRWAALRPDETRLPAGVRIEPIRAGGLDSLLVSGGLDAVIEPNVLPSITARDARVRRLFPDYKAEEQAYYKATRIFPISHVVTFRRDYVERHPEAPKALLAAFRGARDIAIDNIQGADPQVLVVSWITALLEEQRALMGDNYFAYNIPDNRVSLSAMMQFAEEQGFTAGRVDYEDLFAPELLADTGV